MMKSTIKIYAFSAALMLGAVGCKKQLDLLPTDTIVEANAFQSVADLQRGLNTVYARYANYENSMFLASTLADEAKFGPDNGGQGQFVIRYQYNSDPTTGGDVIAGWGAFYSMLDFCNRTLAKIDEIRGTTAEEAQKPAIRGQLLALRAAAHFELFRYYCGNYDAAGLGMVYMEKPSIDPAPRINMGEYFTKLKADLVAAKALVPNNLTDVNRVNVASVAALQARVALYLREWANAEAFATEYINAVPLATRAQFPGIWTDVNTAEQSFRLVRTNTLGGRIGSFFRATSASTTNIGQVTWRPAQKLWDTYDQANDVRFAAYFKDEPLLTSAGRGSRLVQKYAGSAYATPNENVANAKVFRTAEMYLIRAEARAEQGRFSGATGADADINTLRSNRINGYTNVTFTSAAQAINEVLSERYKELCYEGHRFFDLKRRGLPVSRLSADAPSSAGTTLDANNFRFVLPIPLPEMVANPAMKQNPGYQ